MMSPTWYANEAPTKNMNGIKWLCKMSGRRDSQIGIRIQTAKNGASPASAGNSGRFCFLLARMTFWELDIVSLNRTGIAGYKVVPLVDAVCQDDGTKG